jgi:hypothetical protein
LKLDTFHAILFLEPLPLSNNSQALDFLILDTTFPRVLA